MNLWNYTEDKDEGFEGEHQGHGERRPMEPEMALETNRNNGMNEDVWMMRYKDGLDNKEAQTNLTTGPW